MHTRIRGNLRGWGTGGLPTPTPVGVADEGKNGDEQDGSDTRIAHAAPRVALGGATDPSGEPTPPARAASSRAIRASSANRSRVSSVVPSTSQRAIVARDKPRRSARSS